MSERESFAPQEVTLVEERIEQAFAFLKDVLDNPSIAEVVPDSSELRFQEVVAGATTFHLIAFRPESEPDVRWVARVIKPLEYAREHQGVARAEDVPEAGGNVLTRPEVGNTAEAALETLAAKLLGAKPRIWTNAVSDRRTA